MALWIHRWANDNKVSPVYGLVDIATMSGYLTFSHPNSLTKLDNGVFPKWKGNSMNSEISGNLISH